MSTWRLLSLHSFLYFFIFSLFICFEVNSFLFLNFVLVAHETIKLQKQPTSLKLFLKVVNFKTPLQL